MASLVADKTECKGSEEDMGKFSTLVECAEICKGVSSMFAFGLPPSRCNSEGCQCLCETSASAEGTCTQTSHSGYRLYKYRYYKDSTG